jgi:chromosomal replication initiation ATPase DnaA
MGGRGMSTIKTLLSFVPPRFHAPFLDELSRINFEPTEVDQLITDMGANYMSDNKKRDIIIEEICLTFGISKLEIMDKTRKHYVTLPRQIAMIATYFCTNYTMMQTAKYYGKDHATVHHARKVVCNMHDTDREFRTAMGGLKGRLIAKGIQGFEKLFNTKDETQN